MMTAPGAKDRPYFHHTSKAVEIEGKSHLIDIATISYGRLILLNLSSVIVQHLLREAKVKPRAASLDWVKREAKAGCVFSIGNTQRDACEGEEIVIVSKNKITRQFSDSITALADMELLKYTCATCGAFARKMCETTDCVACFCSSYCEDATPSAHNIECPT